MAGRARGILSLFCRSVRGRIREFAVEARQQLDDSAGEVRRELVDDNTELESGAERPEAPPGRDVDPPSQRDPERGTQS